MSPRFAANIIPILGLSALSLAACGPQQEIIELASAQLDLSARRLDFGEVAKGDRLDKEITISNPGDVPLGIENVFLASSQNERAGHEGSFRLLWNCGDVETPNLGDTDSSTERNRGEAPPDDTGDDTGGFDTGSGTGQPYTVPDDCAIPAGGRLNIRVRFQPTKAGGNRDSLIVETRGDDASSDENIGKTVDELNYRDLDNTWKQIFLSGDGAETTPRTLVTPKTLDYGFVFTKQVRTQYFAVRNAGDGVLRLLDVDIDGQNCSDDFVVKGPETPALISGAESRVVSLTYTASDDRKDQCRIRVTTDDPEVEDSEQTIEVLAIVNGGLNPSNQAPKVVIHSPPPGYQHRGLQPIPLELTVFDENEPASGLYCKVRSALQGIPDGRPALADCRPAEGNPSGHQIVQVPVDFYVESGLEVLLVRVTDASGVTREASVPVLINSAFPATDDDGDGFGLTGEYIDCDDTNADIHPLAAEKFDGRDNDCDRLIDEGTDGFDDDGDGMSEAQGDCDDANVETYKGGPEKRDNLDNDCDGIVDETTLAYDDDGDGFTELERDCDDEDPTVNPSAPELCSDGIDNDCDQIPDESDPGGCQSTDSRPMIVGRIDLSATAIEEGGTLAAFVEAFEDDGDAIAYDWQVGDDKGDIDDPTAATINWTAPSEISDPSFIGDIFKIYAVIRDDDGNQDWRFEEVWMYRSEDLNQNLTKVVNVERGEGSGGCSNTGSIGAVSFGALAGLGLLGAAVRRRRED